MRKSVFVIIVFLNLLMTINLSAQESKLDGAILVVNKTRSSVSVVFTDSTKASITIDTEEGPSEIVISPDRKLAVVSHYGYTFGGGSLSFIDLETFTLIHNFDFGEDVRPNGMVFLPETQTQSLQDSISTQTLEPIPNQTQSSLLLVTLETRNSVAVFDIAASKIVREIDLYIPDSTNLDEYVQIKPRLIAMHPTGKSAYVTNEASGNVSVIDLNTFTLAGNVFIGKGIEGIDVSPNGKDIWVANKLDNKIYVIETTDHKVIETFECPTFPTRLKFTPNGKNVIVLNTKSGHITYIDVKTRRDVLYSSSDEFAEIFDEELSFAESDSGLTAVRQMEENINDRMNKLKSGELAIPVSLGISPNGDYAFVSNSIKNSVSVMSIFGEYKFSLEGIFHLNTIPGGVAFLPSEVNVMVDNANSDFDEYWASNRPMTKYYKELANASVEDFVTEFERPFKFVLSRDELKDYKALEDVAAKKVYIKEYINDKDENPLYPVNYWFIEYNGRVSYAKKNYSLKKKPYFDDRGKFYIKFGRPTQKHTDPGGYHRHEFLEAQYSSEKSATQFDDNGMKVKSSGGATDKWIENAKLPPPVYRTLPNEIWSYHDNNVSFTVYFAEEGYYKERRNGLAGILESKRVNDVAWYWMDLVKDRFYVSSEVNFMVTMVERWEIEYEGGHDFTDIDINKDNISAFILGHSNSIAATERAKVNRAKPTVSTRFVDNNLIEFDLESAQFKARNKETRIKFVTYTDPNEINPFPTLEKEKFLNLEMEYLFRDSSLAEIYRDKTNDNFAKYEKLKSIFLTTETSLLPIEGDLTIQLQNTDTKELGFKKYPIAVRDFSGGDLMLSDILYYTPVQSVEFENSYTSEKIKGSEVIPYPYPYVDRDIPVMCYFEVYNLVRGREGTMYEVELKLSKDTSGDNVLQKLSGVFSRGGEEVRSMKYQITEYENDSKQLIGFDLNKVGKGNYNFEITITSLFDENITALTRKKIKIK